MNEQTQAVQSMQDYIFAHLGQGITLAMGIWLSIVFLMAAVLIIYYKQICEGYEDSTRFDIMQKVGMTKRDIRKSINSQMLTVSFLPLLMALRNDIRFLPILVLFQSRWQCIKVGKRSHKPVKICGLLWIWWNCSQTCDIMMENFRLP